MDNNQVLPPEVNMVNMDHPEYVITKSTISPKYQSESRDNDDVKRLKCHEVLNRIVPPREWMENGEYWRQKISNKVVTKLDVLRLSENFDKYLKLYNAQEVGFCPIKEELYSQCFNEIIRIVTLNCTERGNILIHLRDEMKTSAYAYRKLYESQMALGIRKALVREHKKAKLTDQLKELRSKNKALKTELAETISKTAEIEHQLAKSCNVGNKTREEQLMVLRKENQDIKDRLKNMVESKNKPDE